MMTLTTIPSKKHAPFLFLKTGAVCLVFFVVPAMLSAQSNFTVDISSTAGNNGFGMVRVIKPAGFGTEKRPAVNYDEVSGTPYFNSKWLPAILLLAGNVSLKLEKVRLDLYTAEISYIDSTGKEMVAGNDVVKKLYFIDSKDTSKNTAVFQKINGVEGKPQGAYIQVLNSGKVQLLKFIQVVINNSGYDALAGKDKISFVPKTAYYILNDGIVSALKIFTRDAVLAIVPANNVGQSWLETNKNKLKTEADIIGFFTYYNANN